MTDTTTGQGPIDNQVTEQSAPIADALSSGAQLQRARVAAGMSCEQLAQNLCITPKKLKLLENDEYDSLPGTLYVRGYLHNACKALNVDPAPLLEAFERSVGREDRRQVPIESLSRVPLLQKPRSGGRAFLGGGALILLVLVAAALWLVDRRYPVFTAKIFDFSGEPALAANVPAVSPHTAALPAKAEQPPAPVSEFAFSEVPQESHEQERQASPEPAAFTAGQVVEATDTTERLAAMETVESGAEVVDIEVAALALEFSQDAWIKVIDGQGGTLLARLQPAGSAVELSGAPPFQLMLGNAAATKVRYLGKEVESGPIGDQRTRKLLVGG